jgi:hypothetical protein
MATALDIFKFSLHGELESLEREIVQTIQDRIVREGDAFPGVANKVVATVEVDLDKVVTSSLSCRIVRHELKE